MVPMFTPKVIERQFLRAVPKELHTHPMYKELVNQIRASQLAVGSLAPDIQGKTPEGKEVYPVGFLGILVCSLPS